ncbi:MAG: serine hydrolase domain-containing protein [Ilumatobacteraceae bacterium]
MSDRVDRLDPAPLGELVAQAAAAHHCPTVAWGIVLDGSLAITDQIGDVSDRTVYRIASMTKSFSAAATLLLRDDGLLRLDDAVTDHAPELVGLARGDAAPITIRDLLTMTSGLPTDDPWADRHLDLTDDEFDRIVTDGPLLAGATGDAWEYSNFGFAVLGRVVHRATGQRIQQVVTDRLLEPLAMTRTTWVRPGHDDWARPMRWLEDGHVEELAPLADGLIAPMGGIWTTVADLATWVSWLDDAFPSRLGDDDGPLRRSSRRAMQSPQRFAGLRATRGITSPGSYGFGLQVVAEAQLGTVVAHSGGLPGYGSNMRWLPGRRTGAIALANVTYAPMAELTARLFDELHAQGLVPDEVVPVSEHVEATAPRLIALINDWDDQLASGLCTWSFLQDESCDRQRAAAERLAADVGPLTVTSIEAHTAARATIRCTGASETAVTVTFLLAPPSPARIQSYTVTVDADR